MMKLANHWLLVSKCFFVCYMYMYTCISIIINPMPKIDCCHKELRYEICILNFDFIIYLSHFNFCKRSWTFEFLAFCWHVCRKSSFICKIIHTYTYCKITIGYLKYQLLKLHCILKYLNCSLLFIYLKSCMFCTCMQYFFLGLN